MITRIWSAARRLLAGKLLGGLHQGPDWQAPLHEAAQPSAALATLNSGKQHSERPKSGGAAVRVAEILALRPNIAATELGPAAGISVAYARTLLRRARQNTPPPVEPRPHSLVAARQPDTSLAEVMGRLTAAEREIGELRTRRVGPKGRWDISYRAEVIRRSLAGETSGQIASALTMPEGEVRFILKIQRLTMKAS